MNTPSLRNFPTIHHSKARRQDPRSHRLARLYMTTLATTLAAMLSTGLAQAAAITDPINDFLPSYTGPRNADLDVVNANLTLSGAQFVFSTVLAGAVGTTPGALYVLGIDRGKGTSRFPTIAPGVLFDEVVAVTGTGTATVRDLLSNTATVLPGSAVTINGNALSFTFGTGLLPSQGFALTDYTWNLWPRVGTGNDNQISDFAPDNSNARVTLGSATSVPEPATLLLVAMGLAGFIALRRQTNKTPLRR